MERGEARWVGAVRRGRFYKAGTLPGSTQFPLDRASWRRARDGAEAPGAGSSKGEKGAVL